MAEKIHSITDIVDHLESYKKIRQTILDGNVLLKIQIKPPNLSEEVTESLLCRMINGGYFLNDKYGDNAIAERHGKKGADVIVNGKYKLECKGTSSKEGTITVSKTNILDREQWVWMDFSSYVRHNSSIVNIHVINNPSKCIHPSKIEANGESKLKLSKAIKQAKETNNYEFHEFSLNTMEMKVNHSTFNHKS